MKILNLTQHAPTTEQAEAGVYEPKNKSLVVELITFDDAPTQKEKYDRAVRLMKEVVLPEGAKEVMIGGAPFFMSTLETVCEMYGVEYKYSFSKRVSVETVKDGEVTKTSVFKHTGFA